MNEYKHVPVMLEESVLYLHIDPDGFYVDGTYGRGGHSQAILDQLSPKGRLLVIDKDWEAIDSARKKFVNDARVIIRQGSFAHMSQFVEELGLTGHVAGILLDLGFSSPQVDDPTRGFSFMQEGELDMRMDRQTGITAKEWINAASKEDIARVIREYGQDRYHRAIAHRIDLARREKPITTTKELRDIVLSSRAGFAHGIDPATRTFQAIRIHVNQELQDLQDCLRGVEALLAKGGRLVVICFHSLEEQIVKEFFRVKEKGPLVPRKLPIIEQAFKPLMKRVFHKSLQATREEVKANPRAQCARMRVGEKIE